MPSGSPSVDDSVVLREAEDSGSRVPFLRLWSHTSYLDKTEAHLVEAVHGFPVLVKSRSNAHWVPELVAEDSHFQHFRVLVLSSRKEPQGGEANGQPVG